MDSISSNSNTENYPEYMDSSKTKTVDSQPTRAARKTSVDSKSLDPSSLDLYKNSREPRTTTNVPTTAPEKKNESFFSKLKLSFENKCGCCLCFD